MSGGVRAALDQAMEGEGDMGQVVQSGLFDDLDADETGATDKPSPLSAALAPAKRGPGRKRGSKNRRTEAVISWLLTQHRHPLSVMMEAYSMSPKEFAKVALGETEPDADRLFEIVKLQLRMAEAVAPYIAQRQPQAVQLAAAAQLNVSFGGVNLGAGGISGPARGEGLEILEGQAMAVQLGKSDAESRTDD